MAEQVALKDPYTEKRIYGARTVFAALVVFALLFLLMIRYFSLQITEHETYRTQSDRNRVQLQPVPPKRGLIYDRNGVLLAENRASYRLTIIKERVEDLGETIELLQQLIDIDDDRIKKYRRLVKRSRPYAAVPLKLKLTPEEIAIISVNRYRLPGVDVDAQLARHYPQGELFAHVLGYVGRISETEQLEIDEVNYSGTNEIGKIGLEKYYEDVLHGKVGYQNVETNARGRVLRILERTNPEPGADLTLHLDAHVQKVAHQALGDERGAVVAIDPRTGGIIAMASTPSFDANLFVGGISTKDYSRLRDSIDLPLFNRALQGQYPPASTVKPLYGLAGLHYGVITPQSKVRDPGWYKLPNDERMYRDWTWQKKKSGHGAFVDLEQSIVESCDTYFYDLAYNMGIDRIHDFMQPFGFGRKTGVDNTNERSGLLPSKDWKRIYKRSAWFHGETLSVGIGQGYLLATPMQLASAMVTMANRGKHFSPRFLKRMGDEELPVPKLPTVKVEAEHWNAVSHAMEEVVHGRKGTANRINRDLKYRIAGKTGSAQIIGIGQDEIYDEKQVAKRKKDHGLFVAYAPADNPKIVVAIIVENGAHGSWVSPIARKVFDAYLLDQGELANESSSGLIAETTLEGAGL
ncbi:MAG: penicillin-binding protein 2 [Oceanicoccus sp.]|uniref:penicillin-binding protein 2 n=1 Tax=Oceanicoccus sp. TaxID=2691044 RepID=UPI00261FC128|nr:penicillin-binding protein 2 [Oceanicoccus sp.]MCP3907012.1 penicillin-binding protein 2 [Oceanicoccus sp.]MDG1773152.1 penicillin-binding protein 2 [Oceanicoccus sp.]